MPIEIRVPTLGESVTEATIGRWFKQAGEAVAVDEPLVELETDKVTVEVPAPVNGVLASIAAKDGQTVSVGSLLGSINEAGGGTKPAPKQAPRAETKPAAARAPAPKQATDGPQPPSVRKLAAESGVDPATVVGTGKGGRVTKGDMLTAIAARPEQPEAAADLDSRRPVARAPAPVPDAAKEERVRMTRLRQTIARRLKEAQNTAAMLTTFNEVDMSEVMALRAHYKEAFEQKHGVRLGFMGFFVKACVQALKDVPSVNGEIDGEDIVYKNYYHIGVAVGTDRGLVVPVVRDADRLSLGEVEQAIAELGKRAREGKLSIEEMQGGTFTISNGGVYGSLLSTPILNAPQSGILGMHKIEERPVAVKGQVAIRPMMYLALSYDHRLVDGREAVTWLVRVKECIEDPARMVLDL
jgi:2-oxoglutarate dehydrogenase E2 component (dihydrolipoamide succinyltransferase)